MKILHNISYKLYNLLFHYSLIGLLLNLALCFSLIYFFTNDALQPTLPPPLASSVIVENIPTSIDNTITEKDIPNDSIVVELIASIIYNITVIITNNIFDVIKIIVDSNELVINPDISNIPTSVLVLVQQNDIRDQIIILDEIVNNASNLIDKNTIFGKAIELPQIYSNDEIFILIQNLITEMQKLLVEISLDDRLLTPKEALHIIIHNDFRHNALFTSNPEELCNVNSLINLLIQDAMIQWALTGNRLYFQVGLGLMIEQLAFLDNKGWLSYYEDIEIYNNLVTHFIARFKL